MFDWRGQPKQVLVCHAMNTDQAGLALGYSAALPSGLRPLT